MHGKILIIDPIATNRIVLKVKLSAAHYDVHQAKTIQQALETIVAEVPDVIMTAAELPDGSAVDLGAAVKRLIAGRDIPMIAIEHDNNHARRLHLLAVGFDDVLSKPLDDTLTLARVRSLVRVSNSASEWRMRDDTSRALGLAEGAALFERTPCVTLISSDMIANAKWAHKLQKELGSKITSAKPEDDLTPQSKSGNSHVPDVFILHLQPNAPAEMLRVLADIRTHALTRHSGVLIVQPEADPNLSAQALDLGANDIVTHEFLADEIALRVNSLVKRKHIADQLRATVRTGLEAAVCDPLTGLHNRRYAMPHLTRIAETASRSGKPFAVMLADMDFFKRINDVYGHAAGDAVLVQTAERLRENLRAVDMVARIGGEEFLIVMPGVELPNARLTAQRLCSVIGETPFSLPNQAGDLDATISIGLAIGNRASVERFGLSSVAPGLLDQADKALYRAKESGRNQVTLSRPAA